MPLLVLWSDDQVAWVPMSSTTHHIVDVQDDGLSTAHIAREQLVASTVIVQAQAAGEGQVTGQPVREHFQFPCNG